MNKIQSLFLGSTILSAVFFIGVFAIPRMLSTIVGPAWESIISYLMALFFSLTIGHTILNDAQTRKQE